MLIGLTGERKSTIASYLREFYKFHVIRGIPKSHDTRRLVVDGCRNTKKLSNAGGWLLQIQRPHEVWPLAGLYNGAGGCVLVLPLLPNSSFRQGQEGFELVDRALARLALLETERLADLLRSS